MQKYNCIQNTHEGAYKTIISLFLFCNSLFFHFNRHFRSSYPLPPLYFNFRQFLYDMDSFDQKKQLQSAPGSEDGKVIASKCSPWFKLHHMG